MISTLESGPVRGVYSAERAAALSGVAARTLHDWASKKIYEPSVSSDSRPRLWSWLDLVVVRAIHHFRLGKAGLNKRRIPMKEIRAALDELLQRGIDRTSFHKYAFAASDGHLYLTRLESAPFMATLGKQGVMEDLLTFIRPYQDGPDLLEPGPLLRIIPGKLSGEPHITNTRITTKTVYQLYTMGLSLPQIHEMYPEAKLDSLESAVNLEGRLSQRKAA